MAEPFAHLPFPNNAPKPKPRGTTLLTSIEPKPLKYPIAEFMKCLVLFSTSKLNTPRFNFEVVLLGVDKY